MAAPRTRFTAVDCDCDSFIRPHGTQHNYQYHGCGCDPCRQAYLQYLVTLRDRAARGESAYVPVAPVSAHLHALARNGIPIRVVAERCGYSPSALYSISRAARPTCRREVAADVMAHPLPQGAAA